MNKYLKSYLFILISLSSSSIVAQTKDSPYTVGELLSQRDALASSGETVWVRADLKGLGEDGTMTVNADTEDAEGKTVKHMAALFADATGEFVAYSWQILGQLDIADLTNTKDLLIALSYGSTGHPYGNSNYPEYASNEEPTEPHFSLGEVHGALSLEIKNGFRGYHIASSYKVPSEVVAVRVASNYTAAKGASISYGYYDGAEEGKSYVINKDAALVLMAYPGTYDFVLSADYYEQINSNSLNGGETAGVKHKSKPVSKLCNVPEEEMPTWLKNGVVAAMMAPTALNQQKFYISFEGGNVTITAKNGPFAKVDLGIVKYNFEAVTGRKVM